MKTTKELRDDRAVLTEQMRDIVKVVEKENREMTSEEGVKFDKLDADFNSMTETLDRSIRMDEVRASQAEPIIEVKPKTPIDAEKEYNEVFWKMAKYGMRSLNHGEQDLMSNHTKGTGNQTTTAAEGGYTIPQGFSNKLEIEIAAWGGMIANSTIMKTQTGNTIKYPAVDDTAVSGAILAEGSTMPVSDMAFTTKDLDAYTYTSHVVKISRQLAQDSYFNLPGFLRGAFGRRLGTAMNAHFTTGTGSSQPNGVVTASSVGKTSASNTAVTRSELVDLAHSVDPAYRRNAKWSFNDTTLALIKKLAFGSSDARPLWQLSMREGEPDRLEGFGYFVNQDLDNFGAGNKPIVFGDFSRYVIRMAGDPVFIRLDERYMDQLLTGFLAFQRADGELISTNAVKTMRNPTT